MNTPQDFKLYDAQQILSGIEAFALIGLVLLLAYYFFIRRPIAGKKVALIVIIGAVAWSVAHAGGYYIGVKNYLDYRKQASQMQTGA